MQLSRHWRRLVIALVVIHRTNSVVRDSLGSVHLLEAVAVEDSFSRGDGIVNFWLVARDSVRFSLII